MARLAATAVATAPCREDANANKVKIKILVLGGNGMMGSAFIEALGAQRREVYVVAANRGRSYWDVASRREMQPDEHWIVNRKRLLRDAMRRREHGSWHESFDFVVDFSGYRASEVVQVCSAFEIRGHYIFISSDSVYEVCQDVRQQRQGSSLLSREAHAIRPKSPTLRRKMARADRYGHNKLRCEEFLSERKNAGEGNYVILRLPDVIGARDNTDRFFKYMLWAIISRPLGIPLQIDSFDMAKSQKLSFIEARSVASALLGILEMSSRGNLENSTILNLADGNAHITLEHFLRLMAKNLNIPEPEIIEGTKSFFPSVDRGPISSDLARKMLHPYWTPALLPDAIRRTVQFYSTVLSSSSIASYKTKRDEVADDFADDMKLSADQRIRFIDALKEYCGQLVSIAVTPQSSSSSGSSSSTSSFSSS